jgi:rubredoxin
MELYCPKCGSDKITAHKKGFSGVKAVGGAIVTGGIGILAGTLGSNKIKLTCLSCAFEFKPGQGIQDQSGLNRDELREKYSDDVLKLREKYEMDYVPRTSKSNDWVIVVIVISIILFAIYMTL